jgi:hypothetical protein
LTADFHWTTPVPIGSCWELIVVFRKSQAALVAFAFFLCGCAPLISQYDAESYKNATSLKAEVEALVDSSSENYAIHKKDVEEMTTKINIAYEYAAGIPTNAISAKQWDVLRDPDGALYGEFIRIWKQQGTLGPAFRSEERKQLDEAFDYIICLEVNKKSTQSCSSTAGEAI